MGPKEILLVDDERDEVTILTFLLVAEGYRVQHAFDGLHALQLLSKTAVDLVLTDYLMPRMDGCDLLRMMRTSKETAKTPVLMISALPEVLVRMKCGPVGAFLHKPFPPKLLLSLVRDLLVAET
jgi:two-component system OmpR family response regulator